jgi:fluoride exporter
MRYLLIAAFGGVGSVARFLVGSAVAARVGSRFPWGTLIINVTGSFLIGLVMATLATRESANPNWRAALVVGFLGGYTTFSSFEWETFSAVRGIGFWMGAANVIGSVGLGYIAVWLGAWLGKR